LTALPPLYAIVDVDVCARLDRSPLDLARAYLSGGATLLQLRAKALAGSAFLDLASAMVEDARRAGARVIVNDRADLAALSGAAGIHVGQDDLSPAEVRTIVGDDAVIGLSTHTAAQIAVAVQQPIDYLAIGPIFTTGTKDTGYRAIGHDAVRAAVAAAGARQLPVVAIGGITLETAPSVIAAGAASVAVITDLVTADPAARVRAYLACLSG
jgi:thiamine-phosphate pyrophosphorylase